jgi:hypothetical protein
MLVSARWIAPAIYLPERQSITKCLRYQVLHDENFGFVPAELGAMKPISWLLQQFTARIY